MLRWKKPEVVQANVIFMEESRMIRKVSVGLVLLGSLTALAAPAAAQFGAPATKAPAAAEGFTPGYLDIGPTIGFGSLGSASTAFGGRFEKAIKELPDFGGGILGIQVGATYYSWSSPYWSFKYIPIGVTANYHIKVAESKIDPFIGLGLGYELVSCSGTGLGSGIGCGAASAIYFIGRAGVRYFFSPKMAFYITPRLADAPPAPTSP